MPVVKYASSYLLLQAFRDVVADEGVLPEPTTNLLFSTFYPIYDFHCVFLSELEQRMALWNASGPSRTEGTPRIGDLILRNKKQIKRYLQHIRKHDQVMQELEEATKKYKDFEVAYKEFETQNVCYLPFNAFVVKPSQRIVHYKFLLENALDEVKEAIRGVEESVRKLENFQKVIELESDLIGVKNLVQGREFIREGCLQKIDRKGPQP
ncbi:FERM, ARHGEF and pleckstrin domain-containing protein 2-like [Acropora muricata]|uniref:FERM, ARHGEF and pleckstrin domain-containing protein 2-like n=1 Tax=Acropora muricata TaxID=159855 RepID=UPI0034E58A37